MKITQLTSNYKLSKWIHLRVNWQISFSPGIFSILGLLLLGCFHCVVKEQLDDMNINCLNIYDVVFSLAVTIA